MHSYSLLRHTGAPDDPIGCHFDLLLEDGASCRTWSLQEPPRLDGAAQPAVELPAHRLVWLGPRSAAVSGDRGWAERVMAGHYTGDLPVDPEAAVQVRLLDGDLQGLLVIQAGCCQLRQA